MSAGGRHLHHSTPGILGLLGIGFLWSQTAYTGNDRPPQWGSRITAALYGICSALTLDEFALWMDLNDDYWDAAGRKSVDAAVMFGGLLSIVAIASAALDENDVMPHWLKALGPIRHRARARSAPWPPVTARPTAARSGHRAN